LVLDRHHITLYAVGIGLALILTYAITDSLAARKQAKDEQALAVLKAQSDAKDQQNVQFQKQIQDQISQLAAQNSQLQIQNQTQQKIIQTVTQQLQVQKKTDAALPPTDLANRITTLAPGGTVTVLADGYKIDQPEAVSVAQTLEEVPALTQQITADNKVIDNDTAIIDNDVKVLTAEKQSHASDVSSLQAKLDAANGQIKVEKDKAKHGKLKWFGIGYVAGFGSAVILKVFVPVFSL
jgi:hypothetical protein